MLDPDDAYCSPDAAKMAYEKAEISGADIVHFKNLIDIQKYLEYETTTIK